MSIRLLLPLLLLACGWLPEAHAAITCAVTADTDLDYGNVSLPIGPGTTSSKTTSVQCSGNGTDRGQSVRVCIGLSAPTSPREMRLGTSAITHRIYRDPAYAEEVNFTTTNVERIFTIPTKSDKTDAETLTMYGRLQGSTPAPTDGLYTETVTAQMGWASTNFACSAIAPRTTFTSQARARITASCTVNANPLSFGTVSLLAANIDATTALGLNCTKDAAWTLRLNGGTVAGNVAARRMGAGGVAPGAINYQLRHTGANGPLWGDGTGGTTTLTGTGTGTSQTLTLFGRVPGGQPAPAVGTYSDTVTATVEF